MAAKPPSKKARAGQPGLADHGNVDMHDAPRGAEDPEDADDDDGGISDDDDAPAQQHAAAEQLAAQQAAEQLAAQQAAEQLAARQVADAEELHDLLDVEPRQEKFAAKIFRCDAKSKVDLINVITKMFSGISIDTKSTILHNGEGKATIVFRSKKDLDRFEGMQDAYEGNVLLWTLRPPGADNDQHNGGLCITYVLLKDGTLARFKYGAIFAKLRDAIKDHDATDLLAEDVQHHSFSADNRSLQISFGNFARGMQLLDIGDITLSGAIIKPALTRTSQLPPGTSRLKLTYNGPMPVRLNTTLYSYTGQVKYINQACRLTEHQTLDRAIDIKGYTRKKDNRNVIEILVNEADREELLNRKAWYMAGTGQQKVLTSVKITPL